MFKTVTLALAAIAASATMAAADTSYISSLVGEQDRDGRVELGTVLAANDGTVELFSYHKGEIGALLGSTDVHAGANYSVDVQIARPSTDAIAVLTVNGEVVDTQEIDFN